MSQHKKFFFFAYRFIGRKSFSFANDGTTRKKSSALECARAEEEDKRLILLLLSSSLSLLKEHENDVKRGTKKNAEKKK